MCLQELQEKLQFAQDTESTLKQVQQSKADLESTLSARSAEQLALQAAADQAASQLSETMSTVKRLESKVRSRPKKHWVCQGVRFKCL